MIKSNMADLKPQFDAVNEHAQDLISAGLGFDSAIVKQMSDTDRLWHDVEEGATNQQAEIEKALRQVEEIRKALQKAEKDISETEEKIEQLPPVAANVDNINQQLEDIKVRDSSKYLLFFNKVI